MTEYPKALYKGGFYTEWTAFCRDLETKIIETVIVGDSEMEAQWRCAGYTDAKDLMAAPKIEEAKPKEILTLPKKRGMPKGGWPKKVTNVNSQ